MSSTEQPPQLGPRLAARYEVQETLGEGAMGVVYRALQLSLEREVALKVIRREMFSGEAKDRFLQEARLVARINHPNVVQVHEAGEEDGVPFIAFELVKGSSLRHQLEQGKIDPYVAVQYVKQIAAGLAAAHEQGIVHRDVKPENILLTKAGDAKLSDFGISRPAKEDRPSLTATGTILGSPLYMSPEQAANHVLTGLTDQYSLGVVLFEMLTGAPPFKGSTGEILAQHLRDPIELPVGVRATVHANIVEVLETMVQKDPARRYPTAHDVVAALDRALLHWKGRRLTTIPTPRPGKLAMPRALAQPGVGPELGAAVPPEAPAAPAGASIAPPGGASTGGRRSGARSPSRVRGSGAIVGPRTAVDSYAPRPSKAPDVAFENEPLPMPLRVVLVGLILLSVTVISYWVGRNGRPPAPAHATSGGHPPRRDDAVHSPNWPDGTIVGHVGTRIYHVVGEDQSMLPSRENARTFPSAEEAERAGYRRARR